tara:strand:+ start:1290 stop:1760 length:471 start_codon:yes stop_codon:yes gene_type:complete
MKLIYLNKLFMILKFLYMMSKTPRFILILTLVLITTNVSIGQEIDRYHRGFKKELIESFSEKQKELFEKEKKLWKRHHDYLKETITDIQEKIIQDSSVSYRERRHNLMKSLTEDQKKRLKGFERRIDTIRKTFYNSLSSYQKTLIKKGRKKSKKND